LKVIEIPPLGRLDTSLMEDIKFYARFLAMFAAKMKKDWVKEDKSFDVRGLKQRRSDQEEAQARKDWKIYEKRLKDEKEFPDIYSPGWDADIYREKKNRYNKKKRRKKYKKLWRNTIPLSLYNGKIGIDLNYIIQRRKIRYNDEEDLFNNNGYYFVTKEIEPVIKGLSKKCYSELRERRSETEDCECEAQTIYHHSNIDESLAAAGTKAMYTKHSGRQNGIVESTTDLADRTICLTSETNPKILIEEAHRFIAFRRN
jgi:hypothetical protein